MSLLATLFRVTTPRLAVALLVLAAGAATANPIPPVDPGDPADPSDCGARPVIDQARLSYSTGDLDLCVDGNILVNAPNGVVVDTLVLDAPVDFGFTEVCCLSDQFLPPPDTPLVAVFIGDAVIDWGTFRGTVRLVSSGDITFLVPEPSAAALVGLGLLGLALGRRP